MRALVFLLPVALAACGDRRSFDERYQDTAANLEAKARELDQQANETANQDGVPQADGSDSR
jgi:hypothetical protein